MVINTITPFASIRDRGSATCVGALAVVSGLVPAVLALTSALAHNDLLLVNYGILSHCCAHAK